MLKHHRKKFRRIAKAALLSTVALSGACMSALGDLTPETIEPHIESLIQFTDLPEEQRGRDLTLDEVKAHALENNLAYRTQTERLAHDLRFAKHAGHLPRLYTNAYSRWRSNQNASVGIRASEADQTSTSELEHFTAIDNSFQQADLSLNWSLLDIGLGHYLRQANKTRAHEQAETNLLGCHQLMVDIERAYWRVMVYQRATDNAEALKASINRGLQLSAEHARKNPEDRMRELLYQRELIDIKRWYESIYRGLDSAESELKRLMSLPPNADLRVETLATPELSSRHTDSYGDMISYAYRNRPELRRAVYALHSADIQSRQAMLNHMPALSFFLGANYDSNSFLLNQDFVSAGLNLSWDLVRLFDMPRTRRLNKERKHLALREGQIVALSVVTQIQLARQQVHNAQEEAALAAKAVNIQEQIASQFKQDLDDGTGREVYVIKENLMRDLSRLRRDMAHIDLVAAQARLEKSLGTVDACDGPAAPADDKTQLLASLKL